MKIINVIHVLLIVVNLQNIFIIIIAIFVWFKIANSVNKKVEKIKIYYNKSVFNVMLIIAE